MSVVFERFRALNAYPFKHVDLNLHQQGLVRMAGANGTGKSSVWNLFTQVCQGTSPNAAKKSDIMFTDKDFLLEVTFKRNGSTYVAAHAAKCKVQNPAGTLYGTGVYLFRDGTDISQHRDPDTVKLIRSTLGWSIEEWYGYVLLAQRTTHTLIMGTRSERQQYLSALFNLSPLDTLATHFKLKAEELNDKIEKLEKDKQELQIKQQMLGLGSAPLIESLNESSLELSVLSSKLKRLQEEQVRFDTLSSLTDKLNSLPAIEVQPDVLKSDLQKLEMLQQDHKTATALRSQILSDLDCLSPIASPILPEGWLPEYENTTDIDEKKEQGELSKLIQLESSMTEVTSVQIPQGFADVLNSPDINLASVKKQILEIEARPAPPSFERPAQVHIDTLRQQKIEISYKILNYKTDIQRLASNESVCTKCGTVLDIQDRAQKLAEKQSELVEEEEFLLVLSKKLDVKETQDKDWRDYDSLGPDRSGELPELKSQVELFEKKQQYLLLKKQQERFEEYQKNLKQVQEIPELKERIRVYRLKKEYQTVQEQKIKHEAYLTRKQELMEKLKLVPETQDLSSKIKEIKDKLSALESYATLKEELKSYENAEDKTLDINKVNASRDETLSRMAELKQEVKRLESLALDVSSLQERIASQSELVKSQKKYSLLAKGFGKAGALRELQLSKFSRYLEEALLSHTIKQLPDHRFHLKVDDGIDILAEYIGKEKPKTDPYDIKFMSGGEQGALSVAFLFALDDLLPPDRRSSIKILDEVESFFDKDRQQDFMQYTLPLLKERVGTVVVISHSHAANAGSFDKVWEIKDGVVIDSTPDSREFLL